jgi:formylglycine-generating enzyme required for sulfatase activity
MSAIFISYTRRDPEGDAWADRLVDWFREWGYGFFRDKDHRDGAKAGEDWRATLYAELDDATAMVCLCSQQYDSSPWCVGEVAIAVEKGKTVIPIQLASTADELKQEPLPLLLQTKQAIQVAGAKAPSPEQLAEVKQQLQARLREKLNWRDLQHWDRSLAPYPGLPAFEEQQAPVFFGRDKAIEAVVERLEALALRPRALLLLLGASGYGKSSLVRAGVAPRLKGTGAEGMTVVPPFTPGDEPFQELEEAVAAAGEEFDPADPLDSLRALQRRNKKPVLLVIDQFEELLTAGPKEEGTADQGELFQAFLLKLLRARKPGLMVLATMRTDFLAPLQSRWPALTAMASTITLEPIQPEDFGVLITGPAKRASLTLEAGLETRLVKESGGRDALPLLAFTLEQLWKARTGQCLTLKAYDDLEGVEGAVRKRAKECWDPETSSEAVRQALREAFLDHLVSVGGDGREAKRPAPLAALPSASREIVQKMVDDRLLVLNNGILEIAHEALLRTWDPLVQWLEENQEERLQCLRVKRLQPDLAVEAPPRQRRQALEQLAALAAAGGIEQKAVAKEGLEPLAQLLAPRKTPEGDPPTAPEADRADAALILALIGAEEPLSACLADGAAPVELRRRAAESLGLLAKRSSDPEQRERIEGELEAVLRGDALDVQVVDVAGWKEHDKRLPLLQGASRGLQLAASAKLALLGSGPGRVVPMLTLTALEEAGGLHITTEVVEVEVWRLPLPEGEQLELVMVPGGEHRIGSPADERDKATVLNWFAANRDGCRDPRTEEPLDVEAERRVELAPFWLLRHPISQRQWQAVVKAVEAVEAVERELDESPGGAKAESLWDLYGQPGELAVNQVSWNDSQEWLRRLNRWLSEQWLVLGGGGKPLQLALPGEGQWEAACRAGTATPFHFGDTLDARWARYDASYVFGLGRKGAKAKQPGVNGGCGLVNRYGLGEMHGQLFEWCGDSWHPNPVGEGWHADGLPWEGEDGDLARRESGQRGWKLLRGGSWVAGPHGCRAAYRHSSDPDYVDTGIGLRPCCCPSPPGSLLGS